MPRYRSCSASLVSYLLGIVVACQPSKRLGFLEALVLVIDCAVMVPTNCRVRGGFLFAATANVRLDVGFEAAISYASVLASHIAVYVTYAAFFVAVVRERSGCGLIC